MPLEGTADIAIWLTIRSVLLDTEIHGHIPVNAGLIRPITIVAPKGCLANPTFPAPTIARFCPGNQLADTVMKAIRQGAAGFVSKASPTDVLLGALREVLAGEIWLPPEYRDMSGKRRRAKTVAERYGLTKSQARVLELLAEGKTNREIADLLDVTEGTVKIHVSAIFKAMGVGNRSQALLLAQGKKYPD